MGTTSQKLQYLTTTKGKIKDAINLTNANILSEDTFRSYADKLKQGLVDAINDGGSTIYSNFPKTTGEGTEITLNDTYGAPMEIGLKGNTHQDSYTGKNLCSSVVLQNAQNVRFYFDKKIEKTLTISFTTNESLNNNSLYLSVTNTLATTITANANTKATATFTLSDEQYNAIQGATNPYFLLYKSGAKFTIPTDAQIENGSTATEFEKFVGGSPSPSPDYPQPVKVVTGDNTIVVSDGTNTDNYSLNLGSIELCKIGTYQDYIYKENNKWYKHSEIGKVVLDGTQTGINSTALTITTRFSKYLPELGLKNITSSSTGFNNQFSIKNSFTDDDEHLYFYNDNLYFFYNKSRIADVNALYTYLANNNLIVYGKLKTPTNTEITDTTLIEQLEELEKAKSVDDKTFISQTNANLPFILDVSALSKN